MLEGVDSVWTYRSPLAKTRPQMTPTACARASERRAIPCVHERGCVCVGSGTTDEPDVGRSGCGAVGGWYRPIPRRCRRLDHCMLHTCRTRAARPRAPSPRAHGTSALRYRLRSPQMSDQRAEWQIPRGRSMPMVFAWSQGALCTHFCATCTAAPNFWYLPNAQ